MRSDQIGQDFPDEKMKLSSLTTMATTEMDDDPQFDTTTIENIVKEIKQDWDLNHVAWFIQWEFLVKIGQQWIITVIQKSKYVTVGVTGKFSANITIKPVACVQIRHKDLAIYACQI